MKKFFSFAVVALAALMMTACGVGGSRQYKQGDPAPKIDTDNATVNGRHYDN